jgi:hypothetical protein
MGGSRMGKERILGWSLIEIYIRGPDRNLKLISTFKHLLGQI